MHHLDDDISAPTGTRTGQRVTNRPRKKIFHTDETWICDGDVLLFRTQASGQVYQMRYLVRKEGRYFRKSTRERDLDKAKEVAKKFYYEIMGSLSVGRKIFSITARELVELYLQKQQRRVDEGHIVQRRHGTMTSQLNHFLRFVGEDTKITSIKDKKYRDYYSFRKTNTPKVQNTTLINERATIGNMYKFAIEEGFVPASSQPRWEEISKRARRREHLPIDAYRSLYKYLNAYTKGIKDKREKYYRQLVRDFIFILTNTGLRLGEARQLRWNYVEIIKGKGKYPNAKISVPPEISKVKHRGIRTAVGMRGDIFHRIRKYSVATNPNDYVFADYKNTDAPCSRDEIYRIWKIIYEESGIQKYEVGLPFTFYSLRHTYATYRLNYGNVDVFTLSSVMGCSVKYIEEHYGHPDIEGRIDYITRKQSTYDDADTIFVGEEESNIKHLGAE